MTKVKSFTKLTGGIVSVVKFAHFQNADMSIFVTVLGITYELFGDKDGYILNVDLFLLNKTPFKDEKFGLLASTTMFGTFAKPPNEKLFIEMVVTEAGIAIDVKLVQSLNADKTRFVIKVEIVAVVKLVQPLKVESLILVTEFGIVTDIKLVEPEKAAALINVTVLGMSYELFTEADGYTINVVLALLNSTPFSEEKDGWLGSITMLDILGKP